MKAIKHLHKLIEKLRSEGEYDIANKIEKRALDYYIVIAKSIKENRDKPIDL